MIHGIGIDIVHIPKFKKALEKWGDRFTEKLFTKSELAYCCERKFFEQHLAVRFAAKEAFIKAFGKGTSFADIEVLNNHSGKPVIQILNPQSEIRNLKSHLSLSHDSDYCIAQVILEVY